jgi:hypothetical protein
LASDEVSQKYPIRQVSLVVIHRRASQTIDESLQIAHRLINWWAMFVVVKREIFTCGSVYRHYFVFDRLGETKSVTLTENENNY